MRIWLIRHAATEWSGTRYCGRSDPPLSRAGREDAHALAAALAPLISHADVWSSPLRRARQTVECFGRSPTRVDERLREVDFGDAEGWTFDDLAARHPALAHRLTAGESHIDWPGGEPWSDLDLRVAAVWEALRSSGRDIVVVSHGGPLRALVSRALARDLVLAPCASLELEGPPWSST